jgi:hypothetical protein
MPELSSHRHAASARAAGATTAAAYVTGRDRRRACQRDDCCNQKQIFHDSFLLRFRESSAVNTHALRAFCAEPKLLEGIQIRGGGVGGRSIRADAIASPIAKVSPLKRGVGNPSEIGQKRISVEHKTVQQLLGFDSCPHG